jgi:hypothetical protein
MKKVFMLLGFIGLLIMTLPGIATAKEEMKETFKAGDSIYVCKCGKACDCGTMSYKAGKCGCGKELAKTTVTRTENGRVFYNLDGKEYSAPAAGKYVCGCGSGCGCGTVSQRPGKCACGKPMKKVE